MVQKFVGRENRQGCPLSPLLFTLALAIEPLAEVIRSDHTVFGINSNTGTHKISLYADDVLLFLSKLAVSMHRVITIINQFSLFSGYRINFSKSETMPLENSLTFLALLLSGHLQDLYTWVYKSGYLLLHVLIRCSKQILSLYLTKLNGTWNVGTALPYPGSVESHY